MALRLPVFHRGLRKHGRNLKATSKINPSTTPKSKIRSYDNLLCHRQFGTSCGTLARRLPTMPLPQFSSTLTEKISETYSTSMKQLIDRGSPHDATKFYWGVCRSDLTFQPDSTIFKLLCEGYGRYYMSIARSKADYWMNGPVDPLKKPLYAPVDSAPPREIDAQHIIALLGLFEEKSVKLDDLMCSWLLVASIFTLNLEMLEKHFSSWLQSVMSVPFNQRADMLDCIVYALLDRDLSDQIRTVLEKASYQLSSQAVSAIISWYADQDDIKSALALLDKVTQKSAAYQGTPVTFGFLLRYCQRKKDTALASSVWNRLKTTKIPLSVSLFNDLMQVHMNAGDVEGALDVYDDMLAAGLRADAGTNRILGDVWRR
eukprot:TRINITY_DN6850_c0_g1_i1.p1 TRINITY_DN6850_c0_g1~~TRINITY_DN6850_c0_g1_i1.p1  ORF type:complete len:373 (+),score=8.88 TRINITY_DN6850_c0_g1_i1:39-1157(+)